MTLGNEVWGKCYKSVAWEIKIWKIKTFLQNQYILYVGEVISPIKYTNTQYMMVLNDEDYFSFINHLPTLLTTEYLFHGYPWSTGDCWLHFKICWVWLWFPWSQLSVFYFILINLWKPSYILLSLPTKLSSDNVFWYQ